MLIHIRRNKACDRRMVRGKAKSKIGEVIEVAGAIRRGIFESMIDFIQKAEVGSESSFLWGENERNCVSDLREKKVRSYTTADSWLGGDRDLFFLFSRLFLILSLRLHLARNVQKTGRKLK